MAFKAGLNFSGKEYGVLHSAYVLSRKDAKIKKLSFGDHYFIQYHEGIAIDDWPKVQNTNPY